MKQRNSEGSPTGLWKNRFASLWSLIRHSCGGAGRRESKQLRLRETLSLGERRFLAVVEFHHQDLLIAGTANSITLLTAAAPGGKGLQRGLERGMEKVMEKGLYPSRLTKSKSNARNGKQTCFEKP